MKLALILWLAAVGLARKPPPGGWPAPPAQARVVSVYDGDTMTLETGDKIRLKWVNTPEMRPLEPFAKEAQAFAERFVLQETVELVLSGPNPRDSYGRVLAGIRAPRGDLSEALLRQGYAHLFVIPPDDADEARLLAAEAEARSQRLGIWSTPGMQGGFHITSFHANAAGDDNENVNGEYLRICNISGKPADLGGHRLMDLSGTSHTLASVVIPPGHTVMVRSGRGQDQTDPAEQLVIHLGSDTPLWNNTEEHVVLYDPRGRSIDERRHKGSRR